MDSGQHCFWFSHPYHYICHGFAKFFASNVSFGLDVESTASWGTETANSRNDWTSNRRSTSSICPCGVLLVMFYVVFTPCGRESVVGQPNIQDLYEIGCDRMWWCLMQQECMCISYSTEQCCCAVSIIRTICHSCHLVWPNAISVFLNVCDFSCQVSNSHPFLLHRRFGQHRFLTKELSIHNWRLKLAFFCCDGNVANYQSTKKNTEKTGDGHGDGTSVTTRPMVGEIGQHDLGSKSFDKIQKKMVNHDAWRVCCACNMPKQIYQKKYRLVSSSIYNANLFETWTSMNLPVLQECYFGIQYNKVSKNPPSQISPTK